METINIPSIQLETLPEKTQEMIKVFQEGLSKNRSTLIPVDEMPPSLRVMILAHIDFWKKDDLLLKIEDEEIRNKKRNELYSSHPFNIEENWPFDHNLEKLNEILKWMEEHP